LLLLSPCIIRAFLTFTTISSLSDPRLRQKYDASTQDIDDFAESHELLHAATAKEDDKELVQISTAPYGHGLPESAAAVETTPVSNDVKTQKSTSPSSPSTSTPVSPIALGRAASPVNVNPTLSPPAHLVKSVTTAFREIETLPGCEVMFVVKVVIPNYGVAEAKDTCPSRARTTLMRELVKIGAVTRDRFVFPPLALSQAPTKLSHLTLQTESDELERLSITLLRLVLLPLLRFGEGLSRASRVVDRVGMVSHLTKSTATISQGSRTRDT